MNQKWCDFWGPETFFRACVSFSLCPLHYCSPSLLLCRLSSPKLPNTKQQSGSELICRPHLSGAIFLIHSTIHWIQWERSRLDRSTCLSRWPSLLSVVAYRAQGKIGEVPNCVKWQHFPYQIVNRVHPPLRSAIVPFSEGMDVTLDRKQGPGKEQTARARLFYCDRLNQQEWLVIATNSGDPGQNKRLFTYVNFFMQKRPFLSGDCAPLLWLQMSRMHSRWHEASNSSKELRTQCLSFFAFKFELRFA